eukprot:gene428-766_t
MANVLRKRNIFFLTIICACFGQGPRPFKWEPYFVQQENDLKFHNAHLLNSSVVFASQLVDDQPVYISLTTMASRLHHVPDTIASLLQGTILPSRIFLFLSSEPFMLDKGISPSILKHENWTSLTSNPLISIIFTDNIGPHRKLLPLLQRKWNEDCAIVTVDDDVIYTKTALADLVGYYIASEKQSVVALRTRRMGICADAPPWRLAPYPRKGRWPIPAGGRREMLMLPTGIGGVLYRPMFFHKIIFDNKFRFLTLTGDDLMFRLATMAKNVKIVAACTFGKYDICPSSPRIYSINEGANEKKLKHMHSAIQNISSTISNSRKNNTSSTSTAVLNSTLYSYRRLLEKDQKNKDTSYDSLSNNINNNGGNDDMWNQACEYLKEIGILDFHAILQEYSPKERLPCMIHSVYKRSPNKSYVNFISTVYEQVKSSLQSVYDRRCGVQYCAY